MSKEQFTAIINARLAAGDTPSAIESDFDCALEDAASDWMLWGDGRWRIDTVCAKCGSEFAGVCGGYSAEHPFGRPCTPEPKILRSEYDRRKAEKA